MSRCHEFERAFFLSLHEYNDAKNAVVTMKVALLAAVMGEASENHLRRYYPDCKRT